MSSSRSCRPMRPGSIGLIPSSADTLQVSTPGGVRFPPVCDIEPGISRQATARWSFLRSAARAAGASAPDSYPPATGVAVLPTRAIAVASSSSEKGLRSIGKPAAATRDGAPA